MNVSLVCGKIYRAVYLEVLSEGSLAPVAYIHLRAGENAAALKDELCRTFSRLKWNTPLSTADFEISEDDSLDKDTLKIDCVEEFYDDETCTAKKYPVQNDNVVSCV